MHVRSKIFMTGCLAAFMVPILVDRRPQEAAVFIASASIACLLTALVKEVYRSSQSRQAHMDLLQHTNRMGAVRLERLRRENRNLRLNLRRARRQRNEARGLLRSAIDVAVMPVIRAYCNQHHIYYVDPAVDQSDLDDALYESDEPREFTDQDPIRLRRSLF